LCPPPRNEGKRILWVNKPLAARIARRTKTLFAVALWILAIYLAAQSQESFSPCPKVLKDSSTINISLGYHYTPNSAFTRPSAQLKFRGGLYYEYYARARFASIQVNPTPLIGADYFILTIKTIRREK
jgi:hypothetical protein